MYKYTTVIVGGRTEVCVCMYVKIRRHQHMPDARTRTRTHSWLNLGGPVVNPSSYTNQPDTRCTCHLTRNTLLCSQDTAHLAIYCHGLYNAI